MTFHLQPASPRGRNDQGDSHYWLQSTLDQYEVREISARKAVQLITRKRSRPAKALVVPSQG